MLIPEWCRTYESIYLLLYDVLLFIQLGLFFIRSSPQVHPRGNMRYNDRSFLTPFPPLPSLISSGKEEVGPGQ